MNYTVLQWFSQQMYGKRVNLLTSTEWWRVYNEYTRVEKMKCYTQE
jgi:hypothetical protein